MKYIGCFFCLDLPYFVEYIGYDEYGQRVFIRYGNGVETKYTYDEERRWLENIVTTNERGQLYQNISYSFDMVGNVSAYTNNSFGYETNQYYEYDGLYQLIDARGTSINKQYGFEEYVATYKQKYDFDIMGNMLKKTSSSGVQPVQSVGDDLNYELEYIYDEEYAHRVKQIGDIYYEYDANGNVVLEREGEIREGGSTGEEFIITQESENVYAGDYGWALENPGDIEQDRKAYERHYLWNERNLLTQSSDNNITVQYSYGIDGQRAVKNSARNETLYFNSMWSVIDYKLSVEDTRESKNVFLGSTRLVTKLNSQKQPNAESAKVSTYYYHADHLGSVRKN